VPNPLKNPDDLEERVPLSVDVNDKLSHVLDAVKLIKKELNGKVMRACVCMHACMYVCNDIEIGSAT
jgi:hypothetical protein